MIHQTKAGSSEILFCIAYSASWMGYDFFTSDSLCHDVLPSCQSIQNFYPFVEWQMTVVAGKQ
jgi:hypothetical protein